MNLPHSERLSNYGPLVLRLGLAFVFLWFGFSQLFQPESFYGYLPPMMMHLSSSLPHPLIILNGLAEIILGLLLLTGKWTRVAASLLAAHLFFIILSLGYNEIAVRDFGLMIGTIAIALNGADRWCLDQRQTKGQGNLTKNT